MKWQFTFSGDDRGIDGARAQACEIVAWRFLAYLSEPELIDYLLRELPSPDYRESEADPSTAHFDSQPQDLAEENDDSGEARLLPEHRSHTGVKSLADDNPSSIFIGLNALEIAVIADAKNFLSQGAVQLVVDGIWNGRIIFWESLSLHSKKKAKIYNQRRADPYCRLRVPKYQKIFEAMFFAFFLILYYAVLVERNPLQIGSTEVLLYIWIAAFTYDEFGEYQDAGRSFYAMDFWSLWDIGIIGVGLAYMLSRK